MKSKATKVVVRTCVCCGKKEEKNKLKRFVWREKEPVLDPLQQKAGRGAYCCGDEKCQTLFFKQQKKWQRFFRLY